MKIEVETLEYAMGGVLLIKCEDGQYRLAAYLSKSLNETKRNYEIYDNKMLAVIKGLENWRHLLESTKFKFKVWTDYKNLEYFIRVQKLNCRQVKQAFYLSRFNFNLKYIPGVKTGKADGLSKKLDWKVRVEGSKVNIIEKQKQLQKITIKQLQQQKK